jgi:hypothetical protein
MASNQQDPEKVGVLVAMGFEASSAASALSLCEGHLEQAANHLLIGGTTGPSDNDNTAAASAVAFASGAGEIGGVGGGEDDIRLVNAPISQYSVDNGRSACTCIALYAAQDFLKQHQQQASIVTAEFLQNAILQGVEIYNDTRSVDPTVEHKSAEEVLQTTRAYSSLRMPDSIQQGMLLSRNSISSVASSKVNDDHHPQSLQGLLKASQDATEWTCVLITKTPGEFCSLVSLCRALGVRNILQTSMPHMCHFRQLFFPIQKLSLFVSHPCHLIVPLLILLHVAAKQAGIF